MQVFLVEYFTDKEVGVICGEATQDACLAHIAYNMDDALDWAVSHRGWGDEEPAWHWCITPRKVGADNCFGVGEHFTRDGLPCKNSGVIADLPLAPEEEEEYVYKKCIDPWDEDEEKPKKGTGFQRVALEDIEQAYEDDAHDKFAGIANKLADKLDDMCDIVTELVEDLRNEFPEEE